MNIHVHYTRTLRRAFRPRLRMNRWLVGVYWAIGALFLLSAVVPGTSSKTPDRASTAAFLVAYAVLFAIMPVAGLWLRSVVDRRVGTGTTIDVTVTERLISQRTGIDVREFGWEMVRRVLETRGFWIFVVNRRTTVTLYKSDLNADQRAELEAFLARWRSGQSATWTSTMG